MHMRISIDIDPQDKMGYLSRAQFEFVVSNPTGLYHNLRITKTHPSAMPDGPIQTLYLQANEIEPVQDIIKYLVRQMGMVPDETH